MSDYGIKVSRDGVDVKTATGKELIFTSSRKFLKEANKFTGTASSIPVDSIYKSDSEHPHGLSYTPFVGGYVKESGTDYWLKLPFYGQDSGGGDITAWCFGTDAYAKIHITRIGGSGTVTFDYILYNHLDKGKA